MSMVHTPGPWKALETVVVAKISVINDGRLVFSDDGTNTPVASIDSPSSEADARLIAAAPEMLDALRHIERIAAGEAPESNYASRERERAYLHLVRSAIAKATGGRPPKLDVAGIADAYGAELARRIATQAKQKSAEGGVDA